MRRLTLAALALAALISAPDLAGAGTITYSLVNYPDDQNGATLSGSITTDGTIGYLDPSNILSWTWTITPSGGGAFSSSSSDAGSITYLQNSTSLFASVAELTVAAAGALGGNAFAMVNGQTGTNVEYDRFTIGQYSASGPGTVNIWVTPNPSMGGNDPWVIAVAVSPVPEPSSIALVGLAGACGLAFRSARKRSL